MNNDIVILEDIEQNTKLNKGVRAYNWRIVSYQPLEELKPLIDKSTNYAYIFHNKDIAKNPHYHLLLYFVREISFKQIKEILKSFNNSNQNTFLQPMLDKKAMWEYLTHRNHPDKFQYEETDIITNNASFFSLRKAEKNIIELIDDILNGMSEREKVKKWGRDYIINRQKYFDMSYIIYNEEHFNNNTNR